MGLRKKAIETPNNSETDCRTSARDFNGLIAELSSDDMGKRRWAARDLAEYKESVASLLAALLREEEHPVREAIFDSLAIIGGEEVVSGLIDILRLEDAALRNSAIEVLQSMPEAVALHIIELLNDKDSDVRIFAIDILQVLAHPQTPQWLLSVLKDEQHINVVATAVDRLSEVGTEDMLEELESIKLRFPDQPYLSFAVDTAVRRIKGS